MKNLILTLLLTTCTFLGAAGQTSPFKEREVKETRGDYNHLDVHRIYYQDIRLTVDYETMYVYEDPAYKSETQIVVSQDHHTFVLSNNGYYSEKPQSLYFKLNELNAGDTLIYVNFYCDSLTGSARFTRHYYIGATRSGAVSTNKIKENNKLAIYPNPVKNTLNINDIDEPFTYMVYDIMGRAVIGGNSNKNTLDTSYLQTGQYILHIKTGDKEYSSQIQKL